MIPSNTLEVLSALCFLGSAALSLGLLSIAAWGAIKLRPPLIKLGLIGAGGLATFYGALLAGAGILSRDRLLRVGEEKYFCEFDCHLAYSVTSIQRVPNVPGATGSVWAVALRTHFDERTISPSRPREAPLTPNPRRVRLETTTGAMLDPLEESDAELAALGLSSTPLTRALIPGASYTTTLLFDVPTGSGAPARLSLVDPSFPNQLLIGNEQSPFHGETRLAVPESTVAIRP